MTAKDFFQRTVWGAAVGVIATVAYRGIQGVSLARASLRHECWSWDRLAFDPAWVWPYLSMFLLVGLPWYLLPTLREVRRYAFCLLAVAAVGWITFLLYPTACVRPSAAGQPGYYALLQVLDRPNNCMPCLHSALSVLAAWTLMRSCAVFRRPAGAALLIGWLLVLCISIVALRQHTDLDTLVGVALGCLGGLLFQFRSPRSQDAVVI